MPRQRDIKKNQNREHTQKDTFRWSTPDMVVAARTVDAYAKPAMSTTGEAIHGALKNFTSAGNTMARLMSDQAEKDIATGKQKRAAGVELTPEDNGRIARGHEMMDGYLSSDVIEQQINDPENWDKIKDLPPAEFRQQVEIKMNQYLADKGDDFIAGMTPEVPKIFAKAQAQHTQYRTAKLQERGRSTIRGVVSKDIKNLQLTDPAIFRPENRERLAVHLRGTLSTSQQMTKAGYALDRTETTKAFIQALKPIIEDEGAVELLGFAFMKDEEGVRLVDTDIGQVIPELYEKGMKKKQELAVADAYKRVRGNHTDTWGKFDPAEAYEALADPAYYESLGLDYDQAKAMQDRMWADNARNIQVQAKERDDQRFADLEGAFEFLHPTQKGQDGKMPAPDLDQFVGAVLDSKVLTGKEKDTLINQAKVGFKGDKGPGFALKMQGMLDGSIKDPADILKGVGSLYEIEDARSLIWTMGVLNPTASSSTKVDPEVSLALKNIVGQLDDRSVSRSTTPLSQEQIYRASIAFKRWVEVHEKDPDFREKIGDPTSSKYIIPSFIDPYKASTMDQLNAKMQALSAKVPKDNNGYPTFSEVPKKRFPNIRDFIRNVGENMASPVNVTDAGIDNILANPRTKALYLHYWETGQMKGQ